MRRRLDLPAMLLAAALCQAAAGDDMVIEPLIAPGEQPSDTELEGGLWALMEKAEQRVAASPNRINDSELEDYLMTVLCKLSPGYCADIRIYIIRRPYFNASMAPNGMMLVWTGFLLRVENEAQLAAVLGHELGHYLRKHTLDQFEDYRKKQNLITFLSLGAAAAANTNTREGSISALTADVVRLGTIASIYKFSRDHEREADHHGAVMMATSGYPVSEAARVWQYLVEEDERDADPRYRGWSFLATHPPPEQREEKLNSYHASWNYQQTVSVGDARKRYVERMGRILDLALQDELDLSQPGRTLYLLERLRDSGYPAGTISYYMGELYRRRGEDGDKLRSMEHFEQSVAAAPPDPRAHKQLGMAKLKAKDMQAARTHFLEYLEASPDSPDQEMVAFYLQMTEQ